MLCVARSWLWVIGRLPPRKDSREGVRLRRIADEADWIFCEEAAYRGSVGRTLCFFQGYATRTIRRTAKNAASSELDGLIQHLTRNAIR